ncbi:MAG: hypothetical protein WCX95_05455, partial [Candidatus Gracilibacteria bacterium]
MSFKALIKLFKKSIHKKGATLIVGLGLSALLIVFAVGVGMVVRSTTSNIKAFKNQWQAQMVAESVKEKLLFMASEGEAGFSLENNQEDNVAGDGCKVGVLDVVYDSLSAANVSRDAANVDPRQANDPDANRVPEVAPVGSRCSIAGKSDELVTYQFGNNNNSKWYTVPKANTGDAGINCSPLVKFTTVEALMRYYSGPVGANRLTQSSVFFNDNPLNHPCNWGKLKFGSNLSSRVVVPLYYGESDGNDGIRIVNPSSERPVDGAQRSLENLSIRVRTPCKPIRQRGDKCLIQNNAANQRQQEINTSNPECMYEDICIDSDRYQLNVQADDDDTLVLWQINGECTLNIADPQGAFMTETCALLPDETAAGEWALPVSSEIKTSGFINGSIVKIDEQKIGKIAYYLFEENLQGERTISNFINLSDLLRLEIEQGVFYTSINKPVLSLNMAVDELKDNSVPAKRIPYLEYQIVTNVPVSNITQQFQ